MKVSLKLIVTSVLAAITASLCCIVPVITVLVGVSGAAAMFSWLEPFRPYLIGITLLILVIAWYLVLKSNKKVADCNCEIDKNPSWFKSKRILGVITLFIGLLLTFPYYLNIFISEKQNISTIENSLNLNEITFDIEGMTCTGCELAIEQEVFELEGVINVNADYNNSNTIIKFDSLKVTKKQLENAILKTGYQITTKK